jgi:hypothetical protein
VLLSQVSRGRETAEKEKEIFGEEFVRPNTDLPDPNTPLRIFLTLEVSAGVFGGAPSVKEVEEIREREGIEEDNGLCFEAFCLVLGGGILSRSGIDREGIAGRRLWVGDSGSSSEDSSLKSESNPDGVAGCGRLLPLIGESSDFRTFGVGRGESGLVLERSTLRARRRPPFFLPLPSPDIRSFFLGFGFGLDFELSPPSRASLPSSSSDES